MAKSWPARLLWFVGLWLAGVLGAGAVALIIKAAMRLVER